MVDSLLLPAKSFNELARRCGRVDGANPTAAGGGVSPMMLPGFQLNSSTRMFLLLQSSRLIRVIHLYGCFEPPGWRNGASPAAGHRSRVLMQWMMDDLEDQGQDRASEDGCASIKIRRATRTNFRSPPGWPSCSVMYLLGQRQSRVSFLCASEQKQPGSFYYYQSAEIRLASYGRKSPRRTGQWPVLSELQTRICTIPKFRLCISLHLSQHP
ncbi:hypothetical protein LY78DRAFT_446406 [Colletotrichum sublineola]|nr:hypothetical protein LY78DRAFT_446406 [Colletotrichum sublineola]